MQKGEDAHFCLKLVEEEEEGAPGSERSRLGSGGYKGRCEVRCGHMKEMMELVEEW